MDNKIDRKTKSFIFFYFVLRVLAMGGGEGFVSALF